MVKTTKKKKKFDFVIDVTADIINNNGIRANPDFCPITAAFKSTGRFNTVHVGKATVHVWIFDPVKNKNMLTDLILPKHVRNKIVHFDRTGGMKPFKFKWSDCKQ